MLEKGFDLGVYFLQKKEGR